MRRRLWAAAAKGGRRGAVAAAAALPLAAAGALAGSGSRPCCASKPEQQQRLDGEQPVELLTQYLPPAARRCWPRLAPEAQAVLWKWCGGCVEIIEGHCHGYCAVGSPFAGIKKEWFDRSWGDSLRTPFWEDLCERARCGELDAWADSPEPLERLSLVLLLDQVPRSIYRGTAQAYASDPKARSVARRALAEGHPERLPLNLRMWIYFPFMHSEQLGDQHLARRLLVNLARLEPGYAPLEESVEAHFEAVRLFGRLPERNQALGRQTTAEEAAFLKMKPTC